MKIFSLLILCTTSFFSFSQVVTHGPIVGGVTDSSCRVFVRTNAAVMVTIQVSNSPVFNSITSMDSALTNASAGNVATVYIKGLAANSKYYVRAQINGSTASDRAQFGTFPSLGTATRQVFLSGSCLSGLSDADSALLEAAQNEKANAFIQYGNWGYPDPNGVLDIYFNNPPSSWAKNYNNVQNIYLERYSSSNSGFFMKSLALDYVYDDHDYMNERAGKQEALGYVINLSSGTLGAPENWDMPAQARLNSILGYQQLFPGYDLQNSSEGIYHSFRSGNCEFFVLDTRSMRGGSDLVSVVKVGNNWVYQPVPGSSILGTNQTNWLKAALSGSTATWKFIISSVPFNVGTRFALDSLIKIGSGNQPYWNPPNILVPLPHTGYSATNHFVDWWAGFKEEADSLMNYVFSNNIRNVFVISGNSGTAGLDDGTNSGLPELNSGNLKIANSQDWLTFQKFMNFNIWNKGGSGLCGESNFNTTYGRMEIFGNDSIRLSAVDENRSEVASAVFHVNEPYKYNRAYHPSHFPTAADDSGTVPNNHTLAISVTSNDTDPDQDSLFVSIKTNPVHGSVLVNSDNTVSYTAEPGYTGMDSFAYRSCDSYAASCPNCATAWVKVQVTPSVGVVEIQNEIQVKIFPNPADGNLLVEVNNMSDNLQFELISNIGERLLSKDFSGKAMLDVSAISPGIYLYYIRAIGGKVLRIGKLEIVR